jgi:hypothetical protein
MSARIIAFPGCAMPVQQPQNKAPHKAEIEEKIRLALGYIQAADIVLERGKAEIFELQALLNQAAPAAPGSVQRKG